MHCEDWCLIIIRGNSALSHLCLQSHVLKAKLGERERENAVPNLAETDLVDMHVREIYGRVLMDSDGQGV